MAWTNKPILTSDARPCCSGILADRSMRCRDHPSRRAIVEQDQYLLKRQEDFRAAADAVAKAFSEHEEVQAVALFGSVAKPLRREVPRFAEFRRYGVETWHECKDVDLAVWLSDTFRLSALGRARSRAVDELFKIAGIGVAHHQVDVFVMDAGDGRYLGRLCSYGTCPKGKPECRVTGCGAIAFLKQHEDFVFAPDAVKPPNATPIFDRKSGVFSPVARG
jgi:hypothetical protein